MGRSHRPSDTSLPLGDIPVGLVPKSVRPKRRVGAALGQRPAPTPQDPLAEEYLRLTGLGLIVDLIPVVAIQTARLQRDRAPADDIALTELKTSLREVGLSNPIRVAQSVKGTYELVQGFRRLTAFRDLLAETGEARWAQIPAGVLPAGQTDAALYRRMVDENLIRTDVSFAEMATLARGYAAGGVDGCTSVDDAVRILFASASPQKRSYIRRFAQLLDHLQGALARPQDIPRALGLSVLDVLDTDADAATDLRAQLQTIDGAEHVAALRTFLDAHRPAKPAKRRRPPLKPAEVIALSQPGAEGVTCRVTRTTCEIRAPQNFRTTDPARLEGAVLAFLRHLAGG